MKPQDCVFFCLSHASKKASRFWKEQVAPFGVTGVQAMVLNFLLDADQVSSVELGQRSGLDSATLTGLLDRLEAMGLIVRRAKAGDRRSIAVCLTDEGRTVARSTTAMIADANGRYLGNLADDEVRQLKSLLAKI